MTFSSFLNELSPSDSDDGMLGRSRTWETSLSSALSSSARTVSSDFSSTTIGSLETRIVANHREHSSNTLPSNALYRKLFYKVLDQDLLAMTFCPDPNVHVIVCGHMVVDGDDGDDGDCDIAGQHEDDQKLNAHKPPVIEGTVHLRHKIELDEEEDEDEENIVDTQSGALGTLSADKKCTNASTFPTDTASSPIQAQISNDSLGSAKTDQESISQKIPTPDVYEQADNDDDNDEDKSTAIFIRKCCVLLDNGAVDTVFVAPDRKKGKTRNACSSYGLMAPTIESDESLVQELLDFATNDDGIENGKDESTVKSKRNSKEEEEKGEEHHIRKAPKKEHWVAFKRSLENAFSKQSMRETTLAYAGMFAPPLRLPISEPRREKVYPRRIVSHIFY